ncbi:hypothetical protein CBR_g36553 [Chara braunii]|uniref:Aminotransferase class I/classII large domain-containing protein n=1 Tax=Chara braunii TaxID=69332 RepID=A0A388JZ52_CHABU|nr:hypothetical protein CBR_g36553 [Chara braunii]|eukprot:GBG63068.1 hypothetical protein CBR_g36553 [Chara braunii]
MGTDGGSRRSVEEVQQSRHQSPSDLKSATPVDDGHANPVPWHQSMLSARALKELGGGTSFFSQQMALFRSTPNLINLGLGAPGYEGSSVARQAAADVMNASMTGVGADQAIPMLNQYSATSGLRSLRFALSSFYKRQFNAEYDPDREIVVTSSGTEAVTAAFFSILNPGDKVVVPQPAWPWYFPNLRLAGGVPIPMTLKAPDFRIDLVELRELVEREEPKMLVLNTPHNPTGHALTREELEGVAQILADRRILVLFDEVYQNIVFPPAEHLRISSFPGMRERTISIGSGGKLYGLTGWRVGWAVGPPQLIRAIDMVHQHSTVCAPVPLQHGIGAALDAEDGSFGGVVQLHAGSYAILKAAFEAIPGVHVCPSDGGYFFTLDIAATGMLAEEFCEIMLKEVGVGVVPMSAFYATLSDSATAKNLVRVSACQRRSQVEEAARRILKFCSAKSRKEDSEA